MITRQHNYAAYPHQNDSNTGVSVWDYYAAAVIQGVIASGRAISYEMAATSTVKFVDAMMAARDASRGVPS